MHALASGKRSPVAKVKTFWATRSNVDFTKKSTIFFSNKNANSWLKESTTFGVADISS